MAIAICSSPLPLVLSSRRGRKCWSANTRVNTSRFASYRGEFSGSRVHHQGGVCYRGAMPNTVVKARVNAVAQLPFSQLPSEVPHRVSPTTLFPFLSCVQESSGTGCGRTRGPTEMCSILACYDPDGVSFVF